jgi:hypothetical protein
MLAGEKRGRCSVSGRSSGDPSRGAAKDWPDRPGTHRMWAGPELPRDLAATVCRNTKGQKRRSPRAVRTAPLLHCRSGRRFPEPCLKALPEIALFRPRPIWWAKLRDTANALLADTFLGELPGHTEAYLRDHLVCANPLMQCEALLNQLSAATPKGRERGWTGRWAFRKARHSESAGTFTPRPPIGTV